MLAKDFKEFVALLHAHEVDYLVVGGYAMAVHGRPRQTGDLDLWVRRTPENAARLIAALNDFGFGGLGLTQHDFLAESQVVQLGYPPLRIDLLTGIDGVDFNDAWTNRFVYLYDGLQLSFIGLDALKANKRAAGRARDIDDLEQLGG